MVHNGSAIDEAATQDELAERLQASQGTIHSGCMNGDSGGSDLEGVRLVRLQRQRLVRAVNGDQSTCDRACGVGHAVVAVLKVLFRGGGPESQEAQTVVPLESVQQDLGRAT